MNTATAYWFTLEPYVQVGLTPRRALLYNTLDGATIESEQPEVVELLQEVLQKENCGVVLLTDERYRRQTIRTFIGELREKYMGDLIDTRLSKGKPVQLLPFSNVSTPGKFEIYKKHNFPTENAPVFENLCEITIEVDATTEVDRLIPFLQSVPEGITFNLTGSIGEVAGMSEVWSFLDHYPSPKRILCSYAHPLPLLPASASDFSYIVTVGFPLNRADWNRCRQALSEQSLPFEYVFEITSLADYREAEQLIEASELENYQLKPAYTGENLRFFEENIFLTKEDILATPLSVKDFMMRQALNVYDFGKIHIRPDGEAYANVHHPPLGNIYTDSLYEIVCNEMEKGTSWFRIRNQAPCNACVFQWFCPSPSTYEILIGRPDLCHVNYEKK